MAALFAFFHVFSETKYLFAAIDMLLSMPKLYGAVAHDNPLLVDISDIGSGSIFTSLKDRLHDSTINTSIQP